MTKTHKINLSDSPGRYISKLSNLIRRHLIPAAASHDITAKEGLTLLFLISQYSEGRNVYQKDIENEYSIRPSTATQLLKRMEKNGLVQRVPDPSDSRLKKIIVADKALSCQDELQRELIAVEEKLIDQIPQEKLDIFIEVIQQMLKNMSR